MSVRIVLEPRPPPRPGIDRSCLTDYRQWPFILPIMKSRQLRQGLDDGAIDDLVQLLASFSLPLQRPTDDIRMNCAEIVVFGRARRARHLCRKGDGRVSRRSGRDGCGMRRTRCVLQHG